MPDPPTDFLDPETEYQWLSGLPPGQRTAERVNRLSSLKQQLLQQAAQQLWAHYEIERLRLLPPDHDQCYALLRQAVDVLLPEDPAVLASMSSVLYTELNNLRANVDCYRAAAAETAKVLAQKVEALRAYWATVCPLDEKFRRDAMFEHVAEDVLALQARAEATLGTCESVRWSLCNHMTTIDRVIGRE